MPKLTVVQRPAERLPVAYASIDGDGFYVPITGAPHLFRKVYVEDSAFCVGKSVEFRRAEIEALDHTPLYKGDTITITL